MFYHNILTILSQSLAQCKISSQCNTAKNLTLLPSIVHNTVKGFRDSGEISVCKGQGQKPLLNVCDLTALSMRNSHATMMNIATRVWEYIGKLLHPETLRRKPYINFRAEMPSSPLGPSACQWKHVLWSYESTFQLVFRTNCRYIFSVPKMKKCSWLKGAYV